MSGLVERLLFLLFTVLRVACLMQGLALLAAMLASPAAAHDLPAWVRIVLDGSLRVGAVLTATGIALLVAGRMSPNKSPDTAAVGRVWPAALGLTLVVLPLIALSRSDTLFVLWQHIDSLVDQVGFREELARGGHGSGLVMLPILVALLVPILESATMFFLVVVPLVMLVPLASRSSGFLSLFAMLVIAQTGLAICSFSASGTLAGIVAEAMTSMQASGDAEVLGAAEIAAQLLGLVDATARGFALPVLGFLLWLPFILLSRQPRRFFVTGTPAPSVA